METIKKYPARSAAQLGKKRGPYNKNKDIIVKNPEKKTIIEVVAYSEPKKNPKKSRTTVAGIINFETKTIAFHGARNNTTLNEDFRRKIGRQIAVGRAKKEPLFVVPFKKNKARETFHAVARQIMKKPYQISQNNGTLTVSVKLLD